MPGGATEPESDRGAFLRKLPGTIFIRRASCHEIPSPEGYEAGGKRKDPEENV